MITDKGSIKTESVSVESALVVYRKKIKIIALIMLIVGSVGLAAYIALSTAFDEIKWLTALLVFAVPFTLGLIGTVTIARVHKREKLNPTTCRCEFFADFFFCTTKTAPPRESSDTDKFAYMDAILKSENEKYGYIYVLSRGVFVPFGKEDLTDDELNAIRKYFRKPIRDGEESAKLENYREDGNELS